MSSVVAVPPPGTTGWSRGDIESCIDEELLREMWQQAEDFGERRRIRARMYKVKEQRLREMMQNDDEALGALIYTDDGTGVTERTETTLTVGGDGTTTTTTRRLSNIQITMNVDGEKATTESISTENVRLGGITLRGVDSISTGDSAADAIINERIRRASQDRTTRYQTIMDQYDQPDNDPVVSITKSTFSIQTGALAGQGYHAQKNKEVRDGVSPTRQRRSSTEDDFSANEARLTSDDEAIIKTEKENIIKVLNNAKTTRKASRDERNSTSNSTRLSRQSEIPVRNAQPKKVNARKTSKELDFSSTKRTTNEKSSPTSPKRSPADTTTKTTVNRKTTTATTPSRITQKKTETKTTTKSSTPTRKSKLTEIADKMDSSIKSEMKKMGTYINTGLDEDDEIISEEVEEVVDDEGNVVKMIRQTRKKKDGTEFIARNIAHSTKVVSNESDIDEILIGNPDHEIIERNVTEELDEEGSKIKIITETRKREDGIEYTTKNVLKTSKIFDFDHPEDIAHDEEDELISSNQTEETDETGTTIQTVIETRRKINGDEYTTKKVYKTCKVSTQITPSEDDEVIDTKEEEEKQDDGSIVRTLIEIRRTKDGQEYTHRQVFKTRRMTLTGVELQQGIPMMQNDDEIIDKEEKEEIDSNGMNVKVVTETRKRKDDSTYTFEYVLRSFKGTKEDVQKMPYGGPGGSNIPVSVEDEIISEEVKEDVQEDGSTVKTIIERRKAKDGTQYLRHRIMRIPKMPEPVLQIASLEDEILNEEKNDEVLDDGIQCRRITERRRSSVSGLQYTLRRTSKVYQQPSHRPTSSEDEIMDENVTEEETDDGSVIKTIIKRFQRPDGSIYNTHHVLKTFKSPGPVKFIGIEDDELIDQSISERETEDGYIVKTINETRCRADGVQYTVERTETSSKHRSELHITFTDDAKNKINVGSPDDVVLSREEQEEEGEDGVIIKTLTEVRKSADGSEYTTKTVVRSTPVLVPDHETCFVVIKPDDGVEEDGLAPSMDDELIYTRNKEETDANGQMITVIIETRQSKATGEKYNITKRVHTKDVVLTSEGEKEIPKELYKTTKMAVLKGVSAPTTQPDDVDDTPYGSVSALKNRFASPQQDKETDKDSSSIPDKTNTINRKKFFEDAAKNAQPTTPSSPKPAPKFTKTKEISLDNQTELASIEIKLDLNQEEASVTDVSTQNITYQEEENVIQTAVAEDKLEMETYIAEKETNLNEKIEEQVNNEVLDVEEVNETEITEKADEIMRESVDTIKESEVTMDVEEHELIPSLDDEIVFTRKSEETDTHGQIIIILIETRVKKLTGEKYNLTREFLKEEYEAEFGSLKEQEPEPKKVTPSKKQAPTTQKTKDKPRKSPDNENKTKRDVSPRKKPDQDDRVKRTPVSPRKAPTKDVSTPSRTTSAHRGREPLASKDPVKRITRPSPHSSPARGSPLRGRSPLRSGTSTPRDGTPTGRQCCQRHREASAAAAGEEQVSPTRTPKEQVSPTRTPKEQVSPTRTPKVQSRVTTPVRKVKSPDEKPKMNGVIKNRLKTDDKVTNVRKKFEKPTETPQTSRVTQSPRKPRVSRSPDKKETPKPLQTKQAERKSPVKPADKSSTKTRPSDFLEQGGKTLMSSLDAKPVVTMPETPSTDTVKTVPAEAPVEEGPVIEDVSMEPDHPYLKVQRPSLVREPSELPEVIGEMPDSTFEDDSDVFTDNNEEQINEEPVIEDITKKEIKEESVKKSKVLEKRLSDKSMNKDSDIKKKENDNKQISDKKKPFDRRSSDTEKKRPFDRKPSDEKLRKQKDEPKRTINKKPFDRKPSDDKIVKKNDEKSLKKRSSEIETVERKNSIYEHQENLKNEKMSLESQTTQYQSVDSETAVSEIELKEITDDVTTVSEETVVESSSSEIHKKAEEMSTQLIEDVERSIASQINSEDTVVNTELTSSQLDEIEASIVSEVESNLTCSTEENVSSEIKSSLKDETKSKSKAEQKSITTKEVNSRKSLFDQRTSASDKKDTPRRKASYEMKGSVSSRKSMFEQSKQTPVPSPIRKPVMKSSPLRGNDKSEQKTERKSVLKQEKKQESVIERKPVKEPIVVRKTSYVLGDEDEDENNKSFVEDIKEDSVEIKKVEDTTEKDDSYEPTEYEPMDSSGQPLFGLRALRKKTDKDSTTTSLTTSEASETTSSRLEEEVSQISEEKAIIISESETASISTEVSETRKISKSEESSIFTESKTSVTEEQLDLDTHVRKERSKSPLSRESSQVRDNKEESPEPFSKEGSPTRFATGKAVDQGFNTKKVRRVERAASSKKLYEDLEVSKENLPSYLANIETNFDVSTLEQMLETAVSYDERRTIRTQLRLAKRPVGNTNKTTATPAYKRFTDSSTPSTAPASSPSITRKAEVKQESKTKESAKKSLSSSEKSVSSQSLENDSYEPTEYEPTDSSGQPMFGLRALRKTTDKDATTTSLTTSEALETTSSRLEENVSQISESKYSRRSQDSKYSSETNELEKHEDTNTIIDEEEIKNSSQKTDYSTIDNENDRLSDIGERKYVFHDSEIIENNTNISVTETKKLESDRSSKVISRAKETVSESSTSDVYNEPLRHQKSNNRSTPRKEEQSDVEKIVSPYGCGPTDENGLPLFGLRALKKRTHTSTDLPIVPSQASSSEKAPEIEPTDISGRPLFGLKALKKTQEEISESQELKSTSTTVSSSSRSSYNTSYVRRDELNERRQEREDEREEEEEESSDDSHSSSESSDEEENSSSKVQGLRDSYKKKTDSQTSLNTEVIKPSARLRDSYITSESTADSSHTQDEEIISNRSKPLRDILQHHESIVTEPESLDEAPREKPKAKLRDLVATDLHDTKHTWDLESDLSTRSQDVKNIINKHEVISVSESSAATSEKKLTSILKKSSTSSMSGSLESSVYVENSTNESTMRQLNSTSDILDTLTEDQINSLSAEFDLRAQEDGVIKNNDSMEKLNQDIDTTGTTCSTASETTTTGEKEFVRKTSYTEIKFSQPSSQEKGASSRVVESSSSATVDTSSNEMRVESSSGGRSFLDDRSKVSGVTDILSRMSATEAVDADKKITSDDQARSLLNRFLGAQVLMTGVESMMANSKDGESKTSSSNVTSSSKSMSVRSEMDNAGRSVITHEASGQASKMASKDGKITENTSKSFSTGPVTTSTTCKAPSEPVLVCGVNITEVTDDSKLNTLLDSCDEYEDRRKVRMRLKALMAEKKALRSELSGHDLGSKGQGTGTPESRTREVQALTTTSNTKQSNLRSTEGELEPIIYDQLKNTLEEAKVRAEDNASGLKGTNTSSLLGSSHYLSYDTNSSKVDEEHLFDSGTESGDDSRNQDEFESFMGGIRSCFRDSNLKTKNNRDIKDDSNFNEFSTELIVEVNSVLDKVKYSLSNDSDQSQIPKEIQGSQGKELQRLIDRLQQSIGGVIEERKVDEQDSFMTDNQNRMIPTHGKDINGNGIEYTDLGDEIEEEGSSGEEGDEEEEEEAEELDSEEEEEEDEEGDEETPNTVINKSLSNNLVRANSSGIIRSSSYASSGADSPAVVTGGLKFTVNLNEAKGITLKLNEMESTSSGSKGMNSNTHSIQTNMNHNSYDQKQNMNFHNDDGEFVDAEEYVSNDGTNEIKPNYQDISQHKATKEVPWKIRAAKKRIESHQTPSIKDENTQYSSGTSEAQGRTHMFGSNIMRKQKSFSNFFNKTPNTAPALIASSKSLGNVNKLADRWNSITNAQSSSDVPQFYKPVYSKSSEHVKAHFNKILTSFSTGSITPSSPTPAVSVANDSDQSDDSDESDDEGEVYSVKPFAGKTGTMAQLPGIFHKHQEPHGVKHGFQKLEGSQVHKRSEMFSNMAKHPQAPQVSLQPFVSKKQVQPNRTFQTSAHLHIDNHHSPFSPPRESCNQVPSQPLKRPTTLAIQPFIIDKPQQPVPIMQPQMNAYNEAPPPPLPQRGEHPQPPPLPERSDSSHQIFKQHSNNNVAAFPNRLQPLPKSKSTPNANIAPEVQELKMSVENRHTGNQSNEYEMHNNVTKAPAFDKSIKTNKVSAMQSRIERRMFGEEKDSNRQNFLSRTRSSGSVLEKARNLDTTQAEHESLEEYEASMQGKTRYNRTVSDDPSSMLFTPEMLVKIAVHKAAISKQLDAGEEQRKADHPNYHNDGDQNITNVYHTQQQNGFCQPYQQQQIQEHAQTTAQIQLEEQQEEEKRQESLKQLHEHQVRQRLLHDQQERQKKLQEQERQRQLQEQEKQKKLQEQERQLQLQEQERQQQLREQQEKEKQRQEQEKQKLQEQERQRILNEQQEIERQRQLIEHQEKQRQLQEQEQQRKLMEQERQRQLQEQERKMQLQEQQVKQRLCEEQKERERQRQLKEQEERERQQKIREEKEREIQRQIQVKQEKEKEYLLKESQERERQRQILEQQEKQKLWQEEQRQIQEQEEKERQKLIQEQQEKQMLWQEQQEIQRKFKEEQEKERLREVEQQQEKQRQWEERQRELQEQEQFSKESSVKSETIDSADPTQLLIEKQAQVIAEQKRQMEMMAEQQRIERERLFAEQQKQLQLLEEQQKQLLLLQQQKIGSPQGVMSPTQSQQVIFANDQQQNVLNNNEAKNPYQMRTTLETRVFTNDQQTKHPLYSPPVQNVQGQHKGILKQNSLPNMLPEQQVNPQQNGYNVSGTQRVQTTNMSSNFSSQQAKQVLNPPLPQHISQQIVTDTQTPPGSPIAFQQPVQVKVRGQMQTSSIKSHSVHRHGDTRGVSASPPRNMQRNLSQERGRSVTKNLFGRQGSVEGAASVLSAALTRHKSREHQSQSRRSVSANRRGSGSVGHESDEYIGDNDTEANDDEVFVNDPKSGSQEICAMVDMGTPHNPVKHGANLRHPQPQSGTHDGSGSDALREAIADMDRSKSSSVSSLPADVIQPAPTEPKITPFKRNFSVDSQLSQANSTPPEPARFRPLGKFGGNATPPEPVRFKIGGPITPPEPARSVMKRSTGETPTPPEPGRLTFKAGNSTPPESARSPFNSGFSTPPEPARSIFKAGFSTPPEPGRTTFKPKFSTPPEPARSRFKVGGTKSSSVSNLIDQVNAQVTVNQTQISDTPFAQNNRDSLRVKSSSISSIQDKTIPKAPASVLKGLATSLSNISSTAEITRTTTSFGNVRTQSATKFGSTPDTTSKQNFAPPPLPTTEMRKEKSRQQALQEQQQHKKSQPMSRVERWNSNPDNFVVPPLPTSTHRYGPGGQMMHRAMSTSSLNPGTTTVTYEQSKMASGQGTTSVSSKLPQGSHGTITVSSKLPQGTQDESNPLSPGKVASVWESAVSKSETSVMTSKKPWQEGTSSNASNHYVKTTSTFLKEENQIESDKISPKSSPKYSQNILQSNRRSKSNDSNSISSSSSSSRKNVWEKQIEQSSSRTDIKSGGFVTGKLNVNNINRLDQSETVVNIKTVKRDMIQGQTKNQAKNWEKIVSEDNKATEKSEIAKKMCKRHLQMWENRGQEDNDINQQARPEKEEKVKMRVKEKQQIWERRNSCEILDAEEREKEERVKRLSKEQVLQWNEGKRNENEVKDTQDKYIRVNKLQTDMWENSLTNEVQTAENPVIWKDSNASPGQVNKDILSKFDGSSPSNSRDRSPPKIIKRSSSAHIKRNIAAFEQGLQEVTDNQVTAVENEEINEIRRSNSNFVKKSIMALDDPFEPENPERQPVPLRHSGSSGLIKNKMAIFDSQGNSEPVEPENILEKRRSIKDTEKFTSLMERTEIRESGSGVQSISLKIPVEALQGNNKRPQSLSFYPPDTNDEPTSSDKLLPRGIVPPPRQNPPNASPKRRYFPGQFEASMTPDQAEKKQSEVASYFQQSNTEMTRMMNQAKTNYKDNSPDSSRSSSMSMFEKDSISGEDSSNINIELMDEWENLLTGTDIHQSIDDVFTQTLLQDLELTEDESEHHRRTHSEMREHSLFRDVSISRESKLGKSQTCTYNKEQHTNLVVAGQSSESQMIESKAVVNKNRLTSEGQKEQSGVAEPYSGDVDVISATGKIGMHGTCNHGNIGNKVIYSDTNLSDLTDGNECYNTHAVFKSDNHDYSSEIAEQKLQESSFTFYTDNNESDFNEGGKQNNFTSTISFTLQVCPEYTSSDDSDTEIGWSDSEAGLADEEDNVSKDMFDKLFNKETNTISLAHSLFNIPKIIVTDYDALKPCSSKENVIFNDGNSILLTHSLINIPKIVITDCDAGMPKSSIENSLPSEEDMNLTGNFLSVIDTSKIVIDKKQTSLVKEYFSDFKNHFTNPVSNINSIKENEICDSSNSPLIEENCNYKRKDPHKVKEVAKDNDSYHLHINTHITEENGDKTDIPSADFCITNNLSQAFEVDFIVPSNQHDSYNSQNEILGTCKKRDTEIRLDSQISCDYSDTKVCSFGNENIIPTFTKEQHSSDLNSLPKAFSHKTFDYNCEDKEELITNSFYFNQDIEDSIPGQQIKMGDNKKYKEKFNLEIAESSHFSDENGVIRDIENIFDHKIDYQKVKDSEMIIGLSNQNMHKIINVNKDFDGNFTKEIHKKENVLNETKDKEFIKLNQIPSSKDLDHFDEVKFIKKDNTDIMDVNHDVELNFKSIDGKNWTVGYTLQLDRQPRLSDLSDTSNTTDEDSSNPLKLSVTNISSSYTKQSEQCSDASDIDDSCSEDSNSIQNSVCSNHVDDNSTDLLINEVDHPFKYDKNDDDVANKSLEIKVDDVIPLRGALEENISWEINNTSFIGIENLENEDNSLNTDHGSDSDFENLYENVEQVIVSENHESIGAQPLPDDVYIVAMITFSVYALLLLL